MNKSRSIAEIAYTSSSRSRFVFPPTTDLKKSAQPFFANLNDIFLFCVF